MTIVSDFNSRVRILINRIKKKIKIESVFLEIESMENKLFLLVSTMGSDYILVNSKEYLLEYKDHILNSDRTVRDSFIMNTDFSIRCEKKQTIEFLSKLKIEYTKLKQPDRDALFEDIQYLLIKSNEYNADQ